MGRPQTVRMTVHLSSGAPFAVEVDADETRLRNLAGNIEKGMAANFLGVELDGTLHLFPLHAIRSVEITPAPKAAIKNVVRDVRRAG